MKLVVGVRYKMKRSTGKVVKFSLISYSDITKTILYRDEIGVGCYDRLTPEELNSIKKIKYDFN